MRTDIQNIQDTDSENSDSDREETATIMKQKLHEPMQTSPATPVPMIYSWHNWAQMLLKQAHVHNPSLKSH